uniref:Glycosyltransferase n=1 Tax=Chenopodium quinoa TaxID=63459 RepID=A0A803MBV8_CHEQI
MIELNENKISKPHVVVVPYPSQGHINPLLQFAKRLASKGVKATLATTKQTMGSISSLRDVAVEAISDGFDDQGPPKVGSEDVFLNSFKSNGSSSLARIIESYQNTTFPVTCVVYDAFLPWALDVAKDYGLLGAAPVEVGCALPKMPLFKGNDLPTFLRKPESYPAYLAMKLRQFSNVDLADWIFCNSFEDLELEITEGIFEKWPAKLIGPMVPSSYLDGRIEGDIGYGASLWKPLSEKCKEWLQNKPKKSVIYISFGSMVSLTQEQMEEIAWALKQSNYYFLWVVRDSQASKLPKEFLEDVEITQKGMVVTWCNQLEVLAHEATACFVTHCGWNSTLEGLSLGVPMVGVPQWSDQLPDAKFIEEVWGVGVWAKEDDKGVELSKKAVSDGGSSDNHVEDFVEHLKCTSFSTKKPNGSLVS